MRGRRPVRQGAVLATAVAVVALVAPAAAGAAVPGAEDGRWYYEATGLADLHQRTTGEGVTIAVIDEAVNPAVADLGGADVQPHEPSYCAAQPGGEAYPATSTEPVAEHTTSIVTMLVGTDAGVGGAPGIPGVAPGATVRTYAVRYGEAPCETPAGQEDLQDDAIRDAVAEGADIIAVPGAASFTTDGVADARRSPRGGRPGCTHPRARRAVGRVQHHHRVLQRDGLHRGGPRAPVVAVPGGDRRPAAAGDDPNHRRRGDR
jgi:hypothetical protein